MEITHHTRSIRIAPRKLRLIIDKLRHLPAHEALQALPTINKGGTLAVAKALKAAIGAAEDAKIDPKTAVIQRAWVDEGKALKRILRHGRGRSSMMMKKYSHIGFVLAGEEMKKPARVRKTKTDAAAADTQETSEQKD